MHHAAFVATWLPDFGARVHVNDKTWLHFGHIMISSGKELKGGCSRVGQHDRGG